MKKYTTILCLSLLAVLPISLQAQGAASSIAAAQQQFDQSHAAFTAILAKHLKNELVDYAGLKKNPEALSAYLSTLAAVPESVFQKWDKKQQMAFLINLYNAATLKLVADHFPLKSIKEIGGTQGPWKQNVVRLFGKSKSLDHVENDLLRPKYGDPRIHFGVNCASIGCPALRAEAFQASMLDAQLDEQARVFLRDATKNKLNIQGKTLELSSIFDWFKADFVTKSGTVEKFIGPYLSEADRKVLEKGGLTMKFKEYDWNVNQR